jgi:hypothetical protein
MSDSGSSWRPDRATLHWLAEAVDNERLAEVVRADVEARAETEDLEQADAYWYAIADSCIETLILPLIARLRNEEQQTQVSPVSPGSVNVYPTFSR